VLETRPWVEDLFEVTADPLHHIGILLEKLSKTGTVAVERLHRRLLHHEVRILARHAAVDKREQDALREAVRLARAWIDRGKAGARPSPSSVADAGDSGRSD